MAIRIFFRTLPYVFMRAVIFVLFTLATIALVAIVGGIDYVVATAYNGSDGVLAIIGLAGLGMLFGLVRLAQRYVLYLVKVGHVAVITEFVTHGALPVGTDQYSFGRAKVVRHFGSASALFAVDQVVAAAVRQVLSWLMSALGCLTQVPGAGVVLTIMRTILSFAGNYVDEAVMGYILMHEDEDVWQAASDGLVLYAQSWKKLLVTATLLGLLVTAVWAGGFIVLLLGFGSLASSLLGPSLEAVPQAAYVIGAIPALLLANVFRWLLVDPLATVAMVVSYCRAIEGQPVSYDLKAQLAGVSGRFRLMTEKARTGLASRPAGL